MCILCTCLMRLILVTWCFSNSSKSKTLTMDRMTIEERARAFGMLVSALFLRQVVFTLKLLFVLSSTLFKILGNPNKIVFYHIGSSVSVSSFPQTILNNPKALGKIRPYLKCSRNLGLKSLHRS